MISKWMRMTTTIFDSIRNSDNSQNEIIDFGNNMKACIAGLLDSEKTGEMTWQTRKINKKKSVFFIK